jgi:hypothetical protein
MADNRKDIKNAGPDEKTRSMIHEGCSISQLADIFDRDRRTVTRYIHDAGVKPCANRNGNPIYKLRDVAGYLCDIDPAFIEERLRTMNPQDLPPLLSKEFWNGKRARLTYLREEGELWETSQIQMLLGVWVKNFVTGVRQVQDTIDRREILSEQQREALVQEMDSLINMTRETLGGAFQRLKDEEDENDEL